MPSWIAAARHLVNSLGRVVKLAAESRRVFEELYGPFVRTRLPMHIFVVSGRAYIEEILVKQASQVR